MAARNSSVVLPIDAYATSEFKAFQARTPLFSVASGRVLVTLTLPERLRAGDVEFACRLAEQAAAYAVEVERLYRSGRSPRATRRSGKEAAA